MSACQSVIGEESLAYLALVVAIWNMDPLTTRYIKCLERWRPFASTLSGVLCGLSIMKAFVVLPIWWDA